MLSRIFKSGGHVRTTNQAWLLVHKHGEYEYRNPDSVYVHSFNFFSSREDALHYLDQHVPKAEQDEWVLYGADSRAEVSQGRGDE